MYYSVRYSQFLTRAILRSSHIYHQSQFRIKSNTSAIVRVQYYTTTKATMSGNDHNIFGPSEPNFTTYPSRRSVVLSSKGMVSGAQPLAVQAGVKILEKGGNAADAAVAVAAALNVTEPMSCGIGGDLFCLFYNADTKKVNAINCSGRSPAALTRERALNDGLKPSGTIPMKSVHAVTVPGAAAGWVDVLEAFGGGNVKLSEVLEPAIGLADDGYPVSQIVAYYWKRQEAFLKEASPNGDEMLKKDGKTGKYRAPKAGEIIRLSNLAETYRTLAKHGKKGFYEGRIAEAIVEVVRGRGGVISMEDLKDHESTRVEPISMKLDNLGVELWECPPNGQGIVALMALGILEQLEKTGKIPPLESLPHNSPEYLHALVESLRIAFADAQWFVTDPEVEKVPTTKMLDKGYLAERAKLFDPKKAADVHEHGSPAMSSSDTVYFAVTDQWGNGCSFIMSNYAGFGSAIIPKGCGFTLQNRGANFNLEENHPNVLKPNKRPYHTIIPALVTQNGELHTVYGVMGGFMQPQGHTQVLLNMLKYDMDPQTALDAPRICIGGFTSSSELYLEEGISTETRDALKKLGHEGVEILTGHDRAVFGRGQVIRVHYDEGGDGQKRRVYSAGSDLRADGQAVGVV